MLARSRSARRSTTGPSSPSRTALGSSAPVRTVTRSDPQPLVPNVTVAGSVQSEIGCPGDWDPACNVSDLTFDTSDGLWKGTWSIPEGQYEWKVAVNDSWDVNYGAGGAAGGRKRPPQRACRRCQRSFTWNQVTHVPSVAPALMLAGRGQVWTATPRSTRPSTSSMPHAVSASRVWAPALGATAARSGVGLRA